MIRRVEGFIRENESEIIYACEKAKQDPETAMMLKQALNHIVGKLQSSHFDFDEEILTIFAIGYNYGKIARLPANIEVGMMLAELKGGETHEPKVP